MPHVLMVSYSGVLGGAERSLIGFAGGLDGTVWLACPEGAAARAARAQGFQVARLRERQLALRGSAGTAIRAAAALAGHVREVREIVSDLDPDVVIVSGMRPTLAGLLGAVGHRPWLAVHHDFLPGPLLAALVRAAARRCAAIVVTSHALAADLDPAGRLGRRLAVIHPGVEATRFPALAAADSPFEVLVLGAIVDWKRIDVALEACAIARRARPELRLRVLGAPLGADGERLLAALRQRATAPDLAGAVELNGLAGDPVAALRRAACLLHCAPREPFGMAVLEALAAGRPAVVPDSAGPAEIVGSDCGLLYPPGDAAAAAAALVSVASDPARAAVLGANGRRRAFCAFAADASRQAFAGVVASAPPSPRATHVATAEQLAIVTVTHNSSVELERLLRSVEQHLAGTQVIVADCASEDDSLAVATRFGCAAPYPIGENVGFGRGCNAGMAQVSAPVTALLNPDVELVDDSLLRLVARLQLGRPSPERLLAPLVLNPDGSRQDTAHPLPCSAAEVLRALIPPAALPGRAGAMLAPWRARAPRRTGWAVGCALLGETATLRALGPFDARIFMYGEDLDLGLRATAAGIETWFCPDARVVHTGAHSTDAAFGGEPYSMLAQARHDVVRRRLGRGHALFDDAAQALTFSSRLALKRLAGRAAAREREQFRALVRVRR
jgi:GT2 family glycosyltransferase/glycosyltransferase involved in cell wall biosynthesis